MAQAVLMYSIAHQQKPLPPDTLDTWYIEQNTQLLT